MTSLLQRAHPLAAAAEQRWWLEQAPRRFAATLANSGLQPLRAAGLETLQINVGRLCNQTCRHCHVDAGPDRRESMPPAVVDACLRVLETLLLPLQQTPLFKLSPNSAKSSCPESWAKYTIATFLWKMLQAASRIVKHAGEAVLKLMIDLEKLELFKGIRRKSFELSLCPDG